MNLFSHKVYIWIRKKQNVCMYTVIVNRRKQQFVAALCITVHLLLYNWLPLTNDKGCTEKLKDYKLNLALRIRQTDFELATLNTASAVISSIK